jgi:hypothetical protein
MANTEWAAWVQAIGSIIAIFASVGIAAWQARTQYANESRLRHQEKTQQEIEHAKTLSEAAKSCLSAISYLNGRINSREAVTDIAERKKAFDIGSIEKLEAQITAIPIHEIPSTLVRLKFILEGTLRQYDWKVKMALGAYRKMDADNFRDFFDTLNEIYSSLGKTSNDIVKLVEKMQVASKNEA